MHNVAMNERSGLLAQLRLVLAEALVRAALAIAPVGSNLRKALALLIAAYAEAEKKNPS